MELCFCRDDDEGSMDKVDHQATDILLPEASVSIFSTDAETLGVGAAMKSDWRFSRVCVDVQEGDVNMAAEVLKGQPSPNLLIVQTDVVDDNFMAGLGDLSGYCDEGTAAIVVGPVNDVSLYRKFIKMGVSDYLVRPIKPHVLCEVIAKSLVDSLGVTDSRLIAFVGAKGGVGTTTLTQIAAWNSAMTLGQKTLLMDASGGWSSLSVGEGFDPAASLREVFDAVDSGNEDALGRMFHEASDNLKVLSTGAGVMLNSGISSDEYEAILDNLMVKSPLVFVDLSGADGALKKAVLSRAHHNVVVTTPDLSSLRLCRSLIKELVDLRGGQRDELSFVLNKQGMSRSHEVPRAGIAEALEVTPKLVLDYMPDLFMKYESEMKGIFSDKKGKSLSAAFLPVLEHVIVINQSVKENPEAGAFDFFGGVLGLGKVMAK